MFGDGVWVVIVMIVLSGVSAGGMWMVILMVIRRGRWFRLCLSGYDDEGDGGGGGRE